MVAGESNDDESYRVAVLMDCQNPQTTLLMVFLKMAVPQLQLFPCLMLSFWYKIQQLELVEGMEEDMVLLSIGGIMLQGLV